MAPVSLIRPNGMPAGYHISQNGGKYFFFIRNYGKYFFRLSDRGGYFSHNMSQKAASISSYYGNFLLLFARGVISPTIAAHQFDFGMSLYPNLRHFSFAVWQQ